MDLLAVSLLALIFSSLLLWPLRNTVLIAQQKDFQDQLEKTVERRYVWALEEFAKVYQHLNTQYDQLADLEDSREVMEKAMDARSDVDDDLIDRVERLEKNRYRLECSVSELEDWLMKEGVVYPDSPQGLAAELRDLKGAAKRVVEAVRDTSREERCLTGQCDPVGCERELCPHRTVELTVSPFRGVLHQFDGQELADTVLLQQPVQIDLADERHWEKEPPKADTNPQQRHPNEQK